MHGRPRETPEQRQAREEKERPKAKAYKALESSVLKGGLSIEDTFRLTARLVEANPDAYTGWNIRKRSISSLEEQEKAEKLHEEMQVINRALQRQPKSYPTWHHRQWVVSRLKGNEVFEKELEMCRQMLRVDSRNFHCWQYRRNICGKENRSAEKEMRFARERLNENPSNHSAWHHRQVCISSSTSGDTEPSLRVDEEVSLVAEALYTEPMDQSAWFQMLSLVRQPSLKEESLEKAKETVNTVLELEPACHLALLCLAEIMREAGEGAQEIRALYAKLARVDPMRKGLYSFLSSSLEDATELTCS